ncbi:MAG TPA: hypothetical protein DCY59_11335 [Micrococcaceae bacterium]|nr:hypothetical protein [Micrococcaceae bacterium]
MSPFRTKRRWQKGTYMQLSSTDRFKKFIYTKQDMDDIKAGRPVDFRKITQRSLARRAEVSQTMISLLASGDRTGCKPETAERIAEALGVDVTVLFDAKEAIATIKIAA